MKMDIGRAIAGLRKTKGMTQEQLADAVGVSAPAVSKWETGQSYPDITLLPPLARLFEVTVDALLAYEPALSDEQREAFCKEIGDAFAQQGWQDGIRRAQMILREHPSDAALRVLFSSLIDYNRMFALTDADRAGVLPLQEEWLTMAAEQGEGAVRDAARKMLIPLCLRTGNLVRAEALIEAEGPFAQDARRLLPTLRLLQNRHEEAERLAQGEAVSALMELQSAGMTLIHASRQRGDGTAAHRYAQALRQAFDAWGMGETIGHLLILSDWTAAMREMERCTGEASEGVSCQSEGASSNAREALVNAAMALVASLGTPPAPSENPLLNRLPAQDTDPFSPAQRQAVLAMLAEEIGRAKAFEGVKGDARITALLESIQARS